MKHDIVEIKAISTNGSHSRSVLEEHCSKYVGLLGIQQKDLISNSYSDMLLK